MIDFNTLILLASRKRIHQAVVLNKEGNLSCLITLEDISEELVGSIRDEHDLD